MELRENTTKKIVYDLMTDFIWLTADDLYRMILLEGWRSTSSNINGSLQNLFEHGKLIRRGQRGSYQYMRTPKNAVKINRPCCHCLVDSRT